MTRRINGWHMTGILVAFFGVVVAVNITMATFATRSFGGTVVDNSYVASQNFNDWLAEAREQDDLQWSETLERSNDRVALSVNHSDQPLAGATVNGIATHPVGGVEAVTLSFVETENGTYRSAEPLPPGRWIIRLEITKGDQRKRILVDLS